MSQRKKSDYSGMCLLVAFLIAIAAMLISNLSGAWEPDQQQMQEQWQTQTQSLDIQPNFTPVNTSSNNLIDQTKFDIQGGMTNATNDLDINYPEQAAPVYAGTLIPTASCRGAIGAGGAVPGVGASLQLAPRDRDCNRRELARMFAGLGEVDFALQLLCTARDIPNELLDVCPRESTVNEYARRATEIIREEASK